MTSLSTRERPRFDTSRIRASFVIMLGALTAVVPFTVDLYLAAFPQIATDLGTDPGVVQLTITATLAGLAAGQLLIGSISDALGRRRPLIAALALYVLSSLAIVVAQSIWLLTALRFIEGLAAAAGLVLSIAIVRDRYAGIQVGKVIARLMLVVGVAPSIAPIVGAQLLALGSWRMMFGALAAFGAVMLVLTILRLDESLPAERRRTGGVGAALRSYSSLLRDRVFMGLALLSSFYLGALFTYVASSSFVFQGEYGLSAQQFAWIFAGGAVAITAGSQLNGAFIGRLRPETILRVAVVAGTVLSAAMLVAAVFGAGLWPLVALLLLTLTTAGFVMPSAPTIALETNAHRAGSTAALLGALQFAVGALIAPVTGLFGQSAVSMAAVIFGAIAISLAILLMIAPSLPRTPETVLLAASTRRPERTATPTTV